MALRYVETILPCSECEFDEAWLADVTTLDRWIARVDDQRMMVCAVIEPEQTDPLLDALARRFGTGAGYRAVVLDALATVPRPPDPEPPQPTEPEPAPPPKKAGSVSREELFDSLKPGTRITTVYVVTLLLSAVVASVGLVRDNVAVIIGAMVIAPLLTPNMALAFATTLGDLTLARRALRTLALGGAIALAFALLVGLWLRVDPTGPELAGRSSAHASDFVVALASGAAGALAFTSGVSASLVGVMVAVALLPPLVAVGLLLGGGHVGPASGAGLLFLINVIGVNLAAIVTFLWRGVRPFTWVEKENAKRTTRIAVLLWAGLLAALAGLVVLASR